jgi:tRNA A37 threonylcarbamoyltransferase TsaD|tara:strand:- start:5 stop:292 length:288 start_codon:yes stop_codon:yes gene_type:complete
MKKGPFKMKGFSGFYTKVKKKLNKSTLTNPKTAREMIADQMDTRIYTRLLKERSEALRTNSNRKFTKEENKYFNYYKKKDELRSKGGRPNKKDRY